MSKPTAITEIDALYDYKDEYPGGKRDGSLVSCGQSEDYNALSYIYDTILAVHVVSGQLS